MKKIKDWSDEKCLKTVIELLENRVSVSTGFIPDEDTGNITHQILYVKCGEMQTVSHPQPLAVPLRLANAEELAEQGLSVQ